MPELLSRLQVLILLAAAINVVVAAPVACTSASGPHSLLSDIESPRSAQIAPVEPTAVSVASNVADEAASAHHLLASLLPPLTTSLPDTDGDRAEPGSVPGLIPVTLSPTPPPPRRG